MHISANKNGIHILRRIFARPINDYEHVNIPLL